MVEGLSVTSQVISKLPQEKMVAVEASDASRFEDLMNIDDGAKKKVDGNNGLGDTILGGIQDIKEGYDKKLEKIDNSLSVEGGNDMASILKIQLDLTKLMIQGELLNKTATQMTHNVDTLLKSQ